jgi:polyisoprenoid-binding protein YceI
LTLERIHVKIFKKLYFKPKGQSMSKKLICAYLGSLFLLSSSVLFADTYVLDASHSRLQFRVKHLGISYVTGSFKEFSGTGNFDPHSKKIDTLDVTINPASIDTAEADRDKDLRSANFFDVEKFKDMGFKSTEIKYKKNGEPDKIKGVLTMHGVSQPITLDVDWGGSATDPWGNEKIAFEAKADIDRTAYGLTWNKTISKVGGLLVGNEVKLSILVEAVKKKAEPAKK